MYRAFPFTKGSLDKHSSLFSAAVGTKEVFNQDWHLESYSKHFIFFVTQK